MSEGRERPARTRNVWLLTGLLLLAARPLLAADDPIPLNQEGQVSMALKEANAQVVVESIVINGRYNFVTKGKIDETVTVNLSNVSIQDALDAVTQAVGLEYRVQGRIVTLYGKESDSSYTQTYKFTVASVGSLGGPGAIIRRLVEGGADAELAEAGAEQAAQGPPGSPRPPSPEPIIGKDGVKGRVIVDKLNNQLVVTALPSLHRKIAKLVAELDKPTVERGGRKARIFELRYITPNLFRQAIAFEIPGFQPSQVLLFTEGAVTNRDGQVQGGAAGAAGGPGTQPSQAAGNPGGLVTLSTGELEGNSKRVLVTDTEDNLNRIENLLKAIDRPPRQVFLDVKLFTVTQAVIDRFGNQLRLIASQSGTSNPIAQFFANNSQSSNNPFKLAVGTLGPEQFQMLSDYLETNNKAHVLSNPKLTVVDGKGAQIRTVQRVPYGETTVNLGVVQTQVKFIDVGITLNFSANILPDNQIKLIVQPEVSSTLSTVVINQNPVPVVSQTTANTTLYLHSAHTALIGGILQQADNRNLTTMPLLGHLPLVGRLFHNHDDADNRTELIITITAKIVEKGDFNVNSRSPGTEQGKYRYLFHDLEEITRRVLFIDEVVDL